MDERIKNAFHQKKSQSLNAQCGVTRSALNSKLEEMLNFANSKLLVAARRHDGCRKQTLLHGSI